MNPLKEGTTEDVVVGKATSDLALTGDVTSIGVAVVDTDTMISLCIISNNIIGINLTEVGMTSSIVMKIEKGDRSLLKRDDIMMIMIEKKEAAIVVEEVVTTSLLIEEEVPREALTRGEE